MFRVLAGAGAAVVAASVAGGSVLANVGVKLYTVSANANFRTGPSTSYAIITVVRAGETFLPRGIEQNGYAAITYQGRDGWVLASLVVPTDQIGTGSDPVISGTAWTTATVNLRSGPSTSNQILRVVPSGSQIGTSTTVQNGFRYVSWDGQTGWMADAYIGASNPDDQGGNYRTTTANLNLRAEPSTSAKILMVIPAGKQVQVLHTGVGQYVNVNYGGYQGWVASAYLK